jgi:hypothetical protein
MKMECLECHLSANVCTSFASAKMVDRINLEGSDDRMTLRITGVLDFVHHQ